MLPIHVMTSFIASVSNREARAHGRAIALLRHPECGFLQPTVFQLQLHRHQHESSASLGLCFGKDVPLADLQPCEACLSAGRLASFGSACLNFGDLHEYRANLLNRTPFSLQKMRWMGDSSSTAARISEEGPAVVTRQFQHACTAHRNLIST